MPTRQQLAQIQPTFGRHGKKCAYQTEYLRKYWADIHQIFSLLWRLLNWHSFCGSQRDVVMATNWFWRLFADVEIYHFHSLLWRSKTDCYTILHGDNSATLFKTLMNFDPATSEIIFIRVVCAIFAATWPQFADAPSFITLAFQNGLQYRNFDFSWFIRNNFFHIV